MCRIRRVVTKGVESEGEREEEISRLEVVEREEQRSDFLSEQVQYIPTVQYRQDDGNMAKRACVC